MKIAIIGAGVSGVISLKYAIDSAHECDVFEQTGELGGIWVYTDEYAIDKNGMPTYRNMYKGLVTNAPKEIMTFLDFQYSTDVKDSYITQKQVLEYIHDFVRKFALDRHIQYYTRVKRVEPNGDQWTVTVVDVKTKRERQASYDAVFVCNGQYFIPRIPEIEGQSLFRGLQIHSRDYRSTELYENKQVLIIGGSSSAVDISHKITAVTKNVYISHWSRIVQKVTDVTIKPSVKQLYNKGAVFSDGTKGDFDIILYCTGYKRFYPFLTKECGITVEDNWVRYLYKQIINIENPTLCFIGIPTYIPTFIISDLQARFALAALDGKFSLPSKVEMLKEINENINELKSKNVPQKHFHKIWLGFRKYTTDLCNVSGIRPFPEVITRLNEHVMNTLGTLQRNTKYVLVDDENFVEIK